MAESLAERLKRLAFERTQIQDAEKQLINNQNRANSFISENARTEFERLQASLKALIEEVNPTLSDIPKYQIFANGMIQQGNYVSLLHFDKLMVNSSDNRLVITFGPHPQAQYAFSAPPETRRFDLYAGCNDAINEILWMGDFGELNTTQLADVILEGLTTYWVDHAPR